LAPIFGRRASDYAAYRPEYPDEAFRRWREMGIGLPGQRLLDLGTGAGALARGFARSGCLVTGLDPDAALLAEARRLDAAAGVTISYRQGVAEETRLEASSWDVVAAAQCWHWFDRNRAAAEVRRLLRPGGALLICHLAYLALPGNVCEASEQLVVQHNPSWAMAGELGIYPAWALDVAIAGLVGIETFSFDTEIAYTHDAWRGRMRSCNGVGATLPPEEVEAYDKELGRLLADRFPAEPLAVPHRLWALVARAPAG
jgi:SAM-dependent methyltransferase